MVHGINLLPKDVVVFVICDAEVKQNYIFVIIQPSLVVFVIIQPSLVVFVILVPTETKTFCNFKIIHNQAKLFDL